MTPADSKRRLKPGDLNHLLQCIRYHALQPFIETVQALSRVLLQSSGVAKLFRLLLVFELRSPQTRDPEKGMLYQVNVIEAVVESLVRLRRRMTLKSSPMLGIRPLLVSEQFVQV